jgi:hypothetical protein
MEEKIQPRGVHYFHQERRTLQGTWHDGAKCKRNDAAVRDAPILLLAEEFASVIVLSKRRNFPARTRNAPRTLYKKDFLSGMDGGLQGCTEYSRSDEDLWDLPLEPKGSPYQQ